MVFIIADDASWRHFGAYGSDEVNTPNIDRLANEGVIFNNSFVSTSSCTPSRASILTGRNGFELEEGASLWGYLPAKFITHIELLEKNGYRVGSTGKGWGPGFLTDRKSNPTGPSYNSIKHYPYKDIKTGQDTLHDSVNSEQGIVINFTKTETSDIDYNANFEYFLKSTDPNIPFHFWIGTYEPHRGYTQGLSKALGNDPSKVTVPDFLPNVSEVKGDINDYYTEIEHIDQQIGKVLSTLEREGHLSNTMIIFTSDNGMPFPRSKATLYDYGTRMPLIVWWGDNIKSGRKIDDLISLTDIAPTILDIAGIGKPAEMSGKSFLPQLTSNKEGIIDANRNKVYMYRERHVYHHNSDGYSTPMRAIRTDEFLLIKNYNTDSLFKDTDGGPTKEYMLQNKDEHPKLYELSFGEKPSFELYDVKNDPYQINNLANNKAYYGTLKRLNQDLREYLIEREDPRVLGDEDIFRYSPYFGFAFEAGLMKWTPDEKGQNLSADELGKVLEKAYESFGEEENFKKMFMQLKNKIE